MVNLLFTVIMIIFMVALLSGGVWNFSPDYQSKITSGKMFEAGIEHLTTGYALYAKNNYGAVLPAATWQQDLQGLGIYVPGRPNPGEGGTATWNYGIDGEANGNRGPYFCLELTDPTRLAYMGIRQGAMELEPRADSTSRGSPLQVFNATCANVPAIATPVSCMSGGGWHPTNWPVNGATCNNMTFSVDENGAGTLPDRILDPAATSTFSIVYWLDPPWET